MDLVKFFSDSYPRINFRKEYGHLPFARRWVEKNIKGAALAFSILEREGVLHSYSQLPEKSKMNVAQAERSLIVFDKPFILTKS